MNFYNDPAIDLVRTALFMSIKIGCPILLAGILVGLSISLIQSITSIQDQTLATVPKIVVMVGAAILLLPWIVQRLIEYTIELLSITM